MATNQVLHGSNRVVEHPNRYKLNAVAGQSNVYDLEKQAGVITDNGTPYNKNILDKIDNVLSYLTPNVEKVIGGFVEHINTSNFPRNALTTETAHLKFTSPYTLENGDTGTLTIRTNSYYNATYDLSNVWKTSSAEYYFDRNNSFILEFSNEIKIQTLRIWAQKFHLKIYGSKDDINYTELSDSTFEYGSKQYCNISLTNTDYYKYYKFENESTDTYNVLSLIIINSYYYRDIEYQNAFTLDNNTTFTNNQRVLVDTPSTLDLTGVESNTLNDNEISTLLKPSTKYELIYDETNNKFNLGGNLTLFDITLTEAVNQIELTNLLDKIDYGKIYEILFVGKTTASSTIQLAGQEIGYASNSFIYSPCIFSRVSNNAITILKATDNYYNNSWFNYIDLSVNQILKCGTSSAKFDIGTRIIIKEVA